jgi:hypothetical protein
MSESCRSFLMLVVKPGKLPTHGRRNRDRKCSSQVFDDNRKLLQPLKQLYHISHMTCNFAKRPESNSSKAQESNKRLMSFVPSQILGNLAKISHNHALSMSSLMRLVKDKDRAVRLHSSSLTLRLFSLSQALRAEKFCCSIVKWST